uniref:FAD-binding PCMH-type domain-containing protein n=1 Tax=Panagrolaimus sp. ES5 TaxID=591445 RepID=A0AC34FBH9_9BILA
MHPIQERLSRGHGSQCGYCSPGFVMAMYALLRNNPYPSEKEIKQTLKGNLCRCTGYRPILEAFNTFTSKTVNGCNSCPGQVNGKCCQKNSITSDKNGFSDIYEKDLTKWENFPKYDPTQELIFPPELIKINENVQNEKVLTLYSKNLTVICPKSLKHVKEFLIDSSQNSKIYHVSSGQALRLHFCQSETVEASPSIWIAYNKCKEMKRLEYNEDEILIGAALTLTEVRNALTVHSKTEVLNEMIWLQDQYSTPSVRNVATWTGSLLSAHGDFPSLASALNLKLYLYNFDTDESSIIRVDENFFSSGKSVISGNNIITHGVIDLKEIKTIRAAKFEPELHQLFNMVEVEFKRDQNRIALNGFKKHPLLFKNIKYENLENELQKEKIPEEKLEGLQSLINLLQQEKDLKEESHFETLQLFLPSENKKDVNGSVGRPLAHQYADRHTTGDAKYVGDLRFTDLLHMALVLSTEAHAEIINVDPSEALKLEGVISYVDVKDIPEKGTNLPGLHPMSCPSDDSTPVFADKEVICIGQTIGAIVAETIEIARKAIKLVKVEYKPLKPIITIGDAIKAKSYYTPEPMVFKLGEDPEKIFKDCAYIVEGDANIPGQQHCYMEPQSAIIIPEENGEWTIFSATQHAANVQLQSACILGIMKNKISVRVKRIGGGFGGKSGMQCGRARSPALIAANKLKKPISCVMDRKEDMLNTGGRHPAFAHYKLGCDSNGKILAGEFLAYINGGYSQDVTTWVLGALVCTGDGTFHVPNMKYTGYACKTHTASNTAMRGFGQPQAIFIIEYAMDKLARKAGILPEKMREMNNAKEGQTRIDGHVIKHDALPKCWEECKKLADYKNLRAEVETFNKNSKTRKRGLALTATRFGLLHGKTFEQAFVLVQIYLDGTVAVSIGGTEMGQGLNIKCLQVASQALNLPIEKITMIEANTEKTANAPVTGGSQGADVYGHAIKVACEQLMTKLEPLQKKNSDKSWEEIIGIAYNECIPLSAGLKSVDIVMDTGDSLNPAIDIGQIEGGFMQMYGHMTMERVVYDEKGNLLTDSFRKYRMPTVENVPERFRVMLLKNSNSYPGAVYSSKGVGEPPLLLGASTFFAIKDAIFSLTNGKAPSDDALINHIEPPLTQFKLRKACDELIKI